MGGLLRGHHHQRYSAVTRDGPFSSMGGGPVDDRKGGGMKIKWGIDDGYVNRRPDWELEVDDEDLDGISKEEQDRVIDEYVNEALFTKINVFWRRADEA